MPSNLTEVMTPYIFYRSLNYYLCDLLRFEFVTPQFLGKVSLGEKTYPGLSIDVVEELLAAVPPIPEQKDAARDNHVIPCVRELSQVMSM